MLRQATIGLLRIGMRKAKFTRALNNRLERLTLWYGLQIYLATDLVEIRITLNHTVGVVNKMGIDEQDDRAEERKLDGYPALVTNHLAETRGYVATLDLGNLVMIILYLVMIILYSYLLKLI